ncbi:hypothetical protein Tco_0637195 [Tanacetum coccineum]
MVEEVTSLKKDFKQKENKYLEEFLDMKALKEKDEVKLYKQDQSLQTVHMLCKPKPYDEQRKDVLKMKAEALKEQTTTSRLIKALTVYPPNTPATLVPRLEAEVDQNVVNRKYDEIERKNLLIANDNLIADCLSKEVFYIATNFELTVSRFTEMHDAHTFVQLRCLELEAELSKLHDKVQKDDHTELVKVNSCTDASRSKPKSNTKKNRISSAKSVNKKKVEAHLRTNKSNLKSTNYVDSSISSKRTVINSNSHSVCKTFMEVWKPKQVKQVWKATGKVLTNVGYQWKPTGRIFTLGEQYPLTRLITSNALPVQQGRTDCPLGFRFRLLKIYDGGSLRNFMKKFIEIVRFRNDHFGAIMGYEDYVIGDSMISRIPVLSAGIPSSTTIDQDAPSPSHSPSSLELQPPISHQGVAAGSTIIEDNPFAHANNDPFVNVFALKPSFEASSSGDVSSAESTHVTQPHNHLRMEQRSPA